MDSEGKKIMIDLSNDMNHIRQIWSQEGYVPVLLHDDDIDTNYIYIHVEMESPSDMDSGELPSSELHVCRYA